MNAPDSTTKPDEEKNHHHEEDDEALSLCDLPENPENEDHGEKEAQPIKTDEDFDFRSWSGRAEMCVADEVFFKGQILPLRHSISSDSGLIGFRFDSRCVSRSESMDHGGVTVSRLTSLRSRSSSSGSGISSSSCSSIATTAKIPKSKQSRIGNNFHTHPSPKPQIRVSKSRPSLGSRSQRSSSAWDFFRLGLVRAPDLGLQDLKARNSLSKPPNFTPVSRNSSSSSSSSSSKIKNNRNQSPNPRRGFFGGCKCSVNVVETVPLSKNGRSSVIHGSGVEEKLLFEEVKIKTKTKGEEKKKEKKEGKQALSRYRTFEWLKQLSHVSYQ